MNSKQRVRAAIAGQPVGAGTEQRRRMLHPARNRRRIHGARFRGTHGPLVSPESFRRQCLPHLKNRVAHVKKYRDQVIFHCCGNTISLMAQCARRQGFILGPSHSIAKNTCYDNFMAMLDEFVSLRDKIYAVATHGYTAFAPNES